MPELDYSAALDAAARALYAQTVKGAARFGKDTTNVPEFDLLSPRQRYEIMSDALEIISPAAPYFAAQGYERGWLDGNGDARSSDITSNPWGDYVQD